MLCETKKGQGARFVCSFGVGGGLVVWLVLGLVRPVNVRLVLVFLVLGVRLDVGSGGHGSRPQFVVSRNWGTLADP